MPRAISKIIIFLKFWDLNTLQSIKIELIFIKLFMDLIDKMLIKAKESSNFYEKNSPGMLIKQINKNRKKAKQNY